MDVDARVSESEKKKEKGFWIRAQVGREVGEFANNDAYRLGLDWMRLELALGSIKAER